MTQNTRGTQPLSLHDNKADVEEKMQKYRVRSKHRGNEMGSGKHGCSEVTISNTRSPDWQERDIKGMSFGKGMSLHESHTVLPLTQRGNI